MLWFLPKFTIEYSDGYKYYMCVCFVILSNKISKKWFLEM